MEITLVTRETDGYQLSRSSGEVDVYTAPQLDEQLSGLVGSRQLPTSWLNRPRQLSSLDSTVLVCW